MPASIMPQRAHLIVAARSGTSTLAFGAPSHAICFSMARVPSEHSRPVKNGLRVLRERAVVIWGGTFGVRGGEFGNGR